MTAPCKGCKNRFLGCHAQCDKYLAFRVQKEKEYDEKSKSRLLYELNNDSYHKNVTKKHRG